MRGATVTGTEALGSLGLSQSGGFPPSPSLLFEACAASVPRSALQPGRPSQGLTPPHTLFPRDRGEAK